MLYTKSLFVFSTLALSALASIPSSTVSEELYYLQKRQEQCGANKVLTYNSNKYECECKKSSVVAGSNHLTECKEPIHESRGVATCDDTEGCGIHCFHHYVLSHDKDDCVCPPGMKHIRGGGCKCKPGYVPNEHSRGCHLPPSARARLMARSAFDFCDSDETLCGSSCLATQSNILSCGGCPNDGGVDCTSLDGVDSVSCVQGKCDIRACEHGFVKSTSSDGSQSCVPASGHYGL